MQKIDGAIKGPKVAHDARLTGRGGQLGYKKKMLVNKMLSCIVMFVMLVMNDMKGFLDILLAD